MKETLTEYLEKQPLARFRKNKDRACVNVLLRKYPHLKEHKDVLIAFVGEYNSMDRMWRLILSEREDLRASDYDDKTKLEQEKMLGLGYEPNPLKKEVEKKIAQDDIAWFNNLPKV